MQKRSVLIMFLSLLIFISACDAAIEKPTDSLTVSELLANPNYNTQVKVYGKVSVLHQVLCTCFELSSNGKTINVWYDMMIEDIDDNGNVVNERPSVDVSNFKNGDYVAVTGELREPKEPGPNSSKNSRSDFWASSIEKLI